MAFPPTCTKTGDYNPGDNAQPVVRCMTCYAEAMGSPWDYTKGSAIAAWNRRTPDPAQIRADALREAADHLRGLGYNTAVRTILALLDTPLSPTAVDGSPAPDSGGKP